MTTPNNSGPVPAALATGRHLRNVGMTQVMRAAARSAQAYEAAYRHQFDLLLAGGQRFNSDDIVAVVGLPPVGTHHNLVGALFNAKLREHAGVWQRVDRQQMGRAKAHARETAIYQLIPGVLPPPVKP